MKTVLVFIGCLLVCAGLAWLGGFNFDRRSADVFFASSMALLWSGFATFVYATFSK